MEGKITAEVRVGLFVLAALAILIAGLLWIAGCSVFEVRRTTYRVGLHDSGGLQPGDRVRMAGVAVGKIRSVEFDLQNERPVLLRVALDSSVALHEDAAARIVPVGVMGTNALALDPGSSNAPALEPGGLILGGSATGINDALIEFGAISHKVSRLLDQSSELMETLSSDAVPILARVDRLLSDDNLDRVTRLLDQLHQTVEEVGPSVSSTASRLETLSTSLDESVLEIPGIIGEARQLIGDLRAALGPDGERLTRLLDTAQRGADSAEGLLSTVDERREAIEATLLQLEAATANLAAVSREIRAQP